MILASGLPAKRGFALLRGALVTDSARATATRERPAPTARVCVAWQGTRCKSSSCASVMLLAVPIAAHGLAACT